jgi:hypothetical protein
MNTRAPQTGGLQLPSDVGIGQQDASAIANEWDTLPYVDARLRSAGMQSNPEPDVAYRPVTAEQLLVPDPKAYATMHSAQSRWFNYVTRIIADIRAELLQVENEMNDIARTKRGHFRSLEEGKKKSARMSAQEMLDNIAGDPTYHTRAIRQQELQQLELKAKAWAAEMESNVKIISRQIENRKLEAQNGNRENNIPGYGGNRWQDRG